MHVRSRSWRSGGHDLRRRALPLVGPTAYQAGTERLAVRPGETVLVHAASVLSLAEAPEAQRMQEAGEFAGKIVLTV